MTTSSEGIGGVQDPLFAGPGSLPCMPQAASTVREEFLSLVEFWIGLEVEEFAALDPEGLPPVVGAVRRT